uniref:Uncharacterized protein isoform X2 n=1 Tax=Nicotiana tabacum TaxID=4097 RepID=A0A1S4B2N8_TOBAC|nr:PREDICTED: uncharacterized protein LOC107803927 isoform X2 [Nicotiana tabacum]
MSGIRTFEKLSHRECCILRNRIDVFCLFLDDGGVRASLRAPQLFHRVPSASHQHNFQAYTCRLMEHGLLSPVSVKSPPPLISSKPESSKVPQQASKNADVKSKKRLKTDCN